LAETLRYKTDFQTIPTSQDVLPLNHKLGACPKLQQGRARETRESGCSENMLLSLSIKLVHHPHL